MVSHSMEDIARATERVIVINNGEIALDDSVDYVFAHEEELKSKLKEYFPDHDLDVVQDGNVMKVIGDFGLGEV